MSFAIGAKNFIIDFGENSLIDLQTIRNEKSADFMTIGAVVGGIAPNAITGMIDVAAYMVEVEFSNGVKLICNRDIPVVTPDGWNTLGSIIDGDGFVTEFVYGEVEDKIVSKSCTVESVIEVDPDREVYTGFYISSVTENILVTTPEISPDALHFICVRTD